MTIADQFEREQALDPRLSFIVQAPAGSGKTEILTQRYLVLLAKAERYPEEIIAITFTKKAASEMRQRIMQALLKAANEPEPETDYAKHTWQLAKAVLDRNHQAEWHLLENPNRLRILTIDALCASISRQLPIVSQIGCAPQVGDDPKHYYQQAALATLTQWGNDWDPALRRLLLHLDNNHFTITKLLENLLAKRDQWLGHLTAARNTESLREILQENFARITLNALTQLDQYLAEHDFQPEILILSQYAAKNIDDEADPLYCLRELTEFPEPTIENLKFWHAFGNLFLTKSFTWRKSITKHTGFPAPSGTKDLVEKAERQLQKDHITQLLAEFAQHDQLSLLWEQLLTGPPTVYDDTQWELLDALITLLPIAAAQLQLIFKTEGKVDFIEITQAALRALGTMDQPSDLALKLDYRIQHLLIDEFQDTSTTHYRFIEQLIQGWQPDDGRTLFLVGDPMQSIYRFREAEVGLFLRTQQYSIANIPIVPITLKSNFRSTAAIVDWNNTHFNTIMPSLANISQGAVPYSASMANNLENNPEAVQFHPNFDDDGSCEANKIVNLVQEYQQKSPDQSITILVRSRHHLLHIIPALRSKNIAYHALELETLAQRPAIQDCLSLTKALLHLDDRLSWLAILRAPWCGLLLKDLHALVHTNVENAIWENCLDYQNCQALSADAKQRLNMIIPILQNTLATRGQQRLSHWIKNTWITLQGPACITRSDITDCEVYFRVLDDISVANDISNFSKLEEILTKRFADTTPQTPTNLHIMTIHKAKGLEFDTVILPGLDRSIAANQQQLLLWLEQPRDDHGSDLLLAPVKPSHHTYDPFYAYIKNQLDQKEFHESARLLYVATTRAKQNLHLLANVRTKTKDDEIIFASPRKTSLFYHLWPLVQTEIAQAFETTTDQPSPETHAEWTPKLHRLASFETTA